MVADPASISGLINRWRADSIALAQGAAVSSWPALTGSAVLTQSTGAAQPSYQTAGMNSQPTVRFDGSSDYMTAATTSTAQPVTVVMVLKLSVSAQQQLVQAGSLQLFSNGSVWAVNTGSTSLTGGTPGTSPTVVTMTATGGTATVYDKGTQVISGSSGTTDLGTPLQIAAFGTSTRSRFLNGDIAEVLVYNKVLSAAERSTVHSYVQDRYAITVSDYVASGPATGTASGTFKFTGTATGKRSPKATATTGTFQFTGTAVGKAPTVAAKGTGAGTFGFTGAATGRRSPKGAAAGTFKFTGAAVGHKPDSIMRVWDGTQWLPAEALVWDGATWVRAPLTVFDDDA